MILQFSIFKGVKGFFVVVFLLYTTYKTTMVGNGWSAWALQNEKTSLSNL
jgi:hypothetical protein